MLPLLAAVCLVTAAGCSDDTSPAFSAPDRAPGVRAPNTAPCDPTDPMRCHLPWPSSRFLAADLETETGVRVAVDPATLRIPDGVENLTAADGFSRITPVIVGVPGPLADNPGDDAVMLYVAEPEHPAYGEGIPVRVEVFAETFLGSDESLLVAYPRVPLPAGVEMVAVVRAGVLMANRLTEVALDRVAPETQEEADLRGYHAPTRALLAEVGEDPASVARVWDFVTRSREQPWRRLRTMREAAMAAGEGSLEVRIDEVELQPVPGAAVKVLGTVVGLPSFDETLPSDTEPVVVGEQETKFRIIVPEGTEDYRVVLYGHGLAGNLEDGTFDERFMTNGAAKLNIEFYGWTEGDVLETLGALGTPFAGTAVGTARLMQALSDLTGMLSALEGALDEALSGPMLGEVENPLVGRHPDVTVPAWGGASLGGSAGLLFSYLEPRIRYSVLNVPGAAWTHFANFSQFFDPLRALGRIELEGDLNVVLALSMTQTIWDEIDGAAWVDARPEDPPVILIQESIGDPILPNIGTDMAARATGAVLVGEAITPIDLGPPQTSAIERTALTQFRTYETDPLDIHGFGARDTPAGEAAREQIFDFFDSAVAGEAEIALPGPCVPQGGCDFAGQGP